VVISAGAGNHCRSNPVQVQSLSRRLAVSVSPRGRQWLSAPQAPRARLEDLAPRQLACLFVIQCYVYPVSQPHLRKHQLRHPKGPPEQNPALAPATHSPDVPNAYECGSPISKAFPAQARRLCVSFFSANSRDRRTVLHRLRPKGGSARHWFR